MITHIKGLNLAVPHNVCPHPGPSLDHDIVLDLDALGPEPTTGRRVRVLGVILQRDGRIPRQPVQRRLRGTGQGPGTLPVRGNYARHSARP